MVAFLAASLLCGCFQATNPFYSESEIRTDKRLEGSLVPEPRIRKQMGVTSLVLELQRNKHYSAICQQGDHWIKLDVVLFKKGTNFFVDISRLADNGTRHEPATGPSLLDMLHLATVDKTHSALPVRFSDDGVTFKFTSGNPVLSAIKEHPTLKFKDSEGSVILLDSIEKIGGVLDSQIAALYWQKVSFSKGLK